MPFTLTQKNHADLEKLNSTYGLRHRGTQTLADIHCQVTKKIYATAEGATELLAIQAAIEVAKTAPKPYAAGEDEAARLLRTENARLTKELADLKVKQGEGAFPISPGDKADRALLKKTLAEAGVKHTRGARLSTLRRLVGELETQGAPA